ncbi:MAG: ABC transporter ATP-binding protein [Gammaproteobacteria bacterium]|nr:ABC transporter ATP-binding protein [Gammaproteobacteria bacterium]MCP5199461.1 ABC transporter ATP-binding protein [Gammaproteobacteria bacterium]
MIEVTALAYEYPGLRALDDVGFAIEAGTITALVGPNGAGKTTLLRCLAGMEQPLAGDIRIAGIDVVLEPRRSHGVIGYLSDFFGLYADLSVRQGLTYVAAANGVSDGTLAALVEQTAAEVGLADRLDQRAGDLSRGLRQRVAIAQAIIHAPRVVLLDEPASGLDPEARYHLGQLFVALRARGMTLVVSSHILAELEAYATHMLILNAGRIVEHRALADTNLGVPLQVDVLGDATTALATLSARPGVGAVRAEGHTVHLEFSGDDAARAALLAALVSAGIAVTRFAPAAENLQQSYLRSVRSAGGEREP